MGIESPPCGILTPLLYGWWGKKSSGQEDGASQGEEVLVALVLVIVMILAMAVSAQAVSITINRDSSYGSGTGDGNTYTYYKMFDVIFSSGTSSSNASGHTNGVPNVSSGTTTGVAYKTTTAVKNAVVAAGGNSYFTFTERAGESGQWTVTWKSGVDQNSTNILAAAAVLKTAAATANLGTGSLTPSGNAWTATVDPGYYVIVGAAGNNLIAATTDITINEKNEYPSLDKTQADTENTTQSHDTRDVAVGDVLTYNVKVTVPKTAKVGDTILVWVSVTLSVSDKWHQHPL